MPGRYPLNPLKFILCCHKIEDRSKRHTKEHDSEIINVLKMSFKMSCKSLNMVVMMECFTAVTERDAESARHDELAGDGFQQQQSSGSQ